MHRFVLLDYVQDEITTFQVGTMPMPRSKALASASAEPSESQDVGVGGDFMATIRKMDGCNSIRLNITGDTIKAIFRTYPAGKS